MPAAPSATALTGTTNAQHRSMATSTMDSGTFPPRTFRRAGSFGNFSIKFSWSSLFAGVITALSLWILLYALGLAMGLSTVDPNEPNSMRGSGIFTGVWSLISPLIALFVGGMLAGKGAVHAQRLEGVLHGVVVWGLTTLIGAWMVVSLLGVVMNGAGKLGQTALSGATAASTDIVGLNTAAEQALGPINERLVSEGKPRITVEQLRSTFDEVLQRIARGQPLDRATVVSSVARNTDLSSQDAEEIAARLDAQVSQTRSDVQTQAAKAADTTGKIFWGVFGALLLGLLAAMLGGLTGAPKAQLESSTNVMTS